MLTIQNLQACSVFPTTQERDFYLGAAYGRFCRTVWLAKKLTDPQAKIMEMGANPYFTTMMLQDELDEPQMTLANWFGDAYPAVGGVGVQQAGDRVFEFHHFNCEDVGPRGWEYAGTGYDLVLFCEILEHMLVDPAPTMRRLAAMLKPSGRLILTTPNVFSHQNLQNWERRVNPFEWYSPHGAYGRHNRLWACSELMTIPGPHRWGLTLEAMFTEDASSPATAQEACAGREPNTRRTDGDTIFCTYRRV